MGDKPANISYRGPAGSRATATADLPAKPRQVTIEIPVDYPGNAISKNHMFHAGNRRYGYNKTASAWKRTLSESVGNALLEQGAMGKPAPPVSVVITGRFRNRAAAPDLHNLTEITADAVQDALGIDDKHFNIWTGDPDYGVLIPSITVTITLNMEPEETTV